MTHSPTRQIPWAFGTAKHPADRGKFIIYTADEVESCIATIQAKEVVVVAIIEAVNNYDRLKQENTRLSEMHNEAIQELSALRETLAGILAHHFDVDTFDKDSDIAQAKQLLSEDTND
jgi:hypothetical protein